MKSAPEQLSKEEVRRVLDAAASDEQDYLFIRLLAKTGRRIGEIYSLTPRFIDFEKRTAMAVVEKKHTQQKRAIFLDDDTTLLLRRWIEGQGRKPDWCVWTKTQRAFQYAIAGYGRKAGLSKKVMPHSFRHYVVTALRVAGWSWEDISKITGHAVQSIRYYDHTDAYLKEADFRQASKEL